MRFWLAENPQQQQKRHKEVAKRRSACDTVSDVSICPYSKSSTVANLPMYCERQSNRNMNHMTINCDFHRALPAKGRIELSPTLACALKTAQTEAAATNSQPQTTDAVNESALQDCLVG
jgi:hypothetical protein